jgi:hypothetical protein
MVSRFNCCALMPLAAVYKARIMVLLSVAQGSGVRGQGSERPSSGIARRFPGFFLRSAD